MPSRITVIRSSNVRFDEDGLISNPGNECLDEPEPELLGSRGDVEEPKNDSIEAELPIELDEPDEEEFTPFQVLAHGYGNQNEEITNQETANSSSRVRKVYEPVSRVTRSGNSILPPLPPPDENIAFASFLAASSTNQDPKTIYEALNGSDENEWREAFRKEYRSLKKNETWITLDRSKVPKGKKVLSGKIVLKTKRNKEGNILKRKVRWVVRGFEQIYGQDYTQTYAGVCRSASWKIVIAIAANFDLEIDQMDAITAFLNSSTDGDIFVELPPMWNEPGLNKFDDPVCKLKKALYGLKQAPRLWQSHLQLKLSEIGFQPLGSYNCIYFQKSSGIILVTYVDDFLIVGRNRRKIDVLKEKLRSKFDLEDLGTANYFLGVRIFRDRPSKRIYLCQDAYIKQILERYSLNNSYTVDCPSAAGSAIHMVKFSGVATTQEISEYQSKIGSLLYLAVHTRPDIAYQCSSLSRFLVNPSPTPKSGESSHPISCRYTKSLYCL